MTDRVFAIPLAYEDVALRTGTGAEVSGLTLEVDHGTVVALVGDGGDEAVRALLGLVRPEEGRALVAGRAIHEHRRPARVLGAVGAHGALPPARTIEASLRVAARLAGVGPHAVAEAAGRAGLDPALLRRRPPAVDGLARRRAALACAFVGWPAAVVLEAPFDRLRETDDVRALATTLREEAARGLAVLFSTSDARIGAAVADRAVAPVGEPVAA